MLLASLPAPPHYVAFLLLLLSLLVCPMIYEKLVLCVYASGFSYHAWLAQLV